METDRDRVTVLMHQRLGHSNLDDLPSKRKSMSLSKVSVGEFMNRGGDRKSVRE